MKQFAFMIVVTLAGTLGVFSWGPFASVAVYYLFAVLRPQYLWKWALPNLGIEWSLIVALAAIGGTVLYILGIEPIRPREDPPFPGLGPTHWLYLTFGSLVILSYFTAQNADVAGLWLTEYLKIFAMFVIGSLVVRRITQVWCLYVVATAALVYIAYEVNALYFMQGRMDIYHNGYGGLDNNGAGLMLAMGVPLSVYAWEACRRWWRWIFAAGVPVLVHAVLMTYSRGAMLALIVSTPLIIGRSRRRWQFSGMVVLMAFAVPVMAGPEIRARFMTLSDYNEDASANARFGSWAAAFRIANEYPLLGVGIRNSNLFSHRYGADIEGRTIHSQYLQILADSGYPALLFYALAILSLFVGTWRARRRLRKRTDDASEMTRSMLSGIEGAVAVFAVGSFFLSLEVFELPYLIALMGGQLAMLTVPVGVDECSVAPQNGIRTPMTRRGRLTPDVQTLRPAFTGGRQPR
jgi:probable O-glycosylation ligase (exosortase A-associated)